jgi:hypothetical protein
VVRALASHARGHWFKSSTAHHKSRSGGMADALRSGRSALKGVRVQVPPSAQKIEYVRVTGKYTERSEGLFGHRCACGSVG